MSDAIKRSLVFLVIEDEENDQLVAEHYLRRMEADVEILFAFDGLEAIEILRSRPERVPDLILLDINMPRMNGHEFLDAWFVEEAADVPIVVMLTSSDQQTDRRRAFEFDNVKDYFVKPMVKSTVKRLELLLAAQDDPRPSEGRAEEREKIAR